ncbi:HlyD family type I secretion periplasmic adaptor subunit [Aestuariivirga sp.]|uniref:HlyD family type I secretion periplasmic adaptor subunit n=1 Tax=Aestuariivirga sp. TaxID=2650926 RepID=UPI00391D9427
MSGNGHALFFREMRRASRIGMAVAAALVFGTGVWAATSEISGAVIAPGRLVVLSEVKKVQHPTGGIVGEILVSEGEEVKAGQPLLRLDDTATRANLGVISRAYDENLAQQARLRSERDGLSELRFPEELTGRVNDDEVAEILAGERRLFELRTIAREGNKARLEEQRAQLEQQIAGFEEQIESNGQQLKFIRKELEAARDLWEKKLTSLAKLNALEREVVSIEGRKSGLASSIAETRGRIAEVELQILQVDRQFNSEVADELRVVEARLGEFRERKVAAEDQLRRIVVRAPASGRVHDLAVHTLGGVIATGEVLMLIVPMEEQLEVEARVSPTDVDQLQPRAPARLRLTAFNQRTTPELEGQLKNVSADVETDQRTGETYYKARIAIPPDQLTRLGTLRLMPGMPVETYITTSSRNVLSLLVKPLTDQMNRAFRED